LVIQKKYFNFQAERSAWQQYFFWLKSVIKMIA
jgi:hypothetical protein